MVREVKSKVFDVRVENDTEESSLNHSKGDQFMRLADKLNSKKEIQLDRLSQKNSQNDRSNKSRSDRHSRKIP